MSVIAYQALIGYVTGFVYKKENDFLLNVALGEN